MIDFLEQMLLGFRLGSRCAFWDASGRRIVRLCNGTSITTQVLRERKDAVFVRCGLEMLRQTRPLAPSLLQTKVICFRCLLRLSRGSILKTRRPFGASAKRKDSIAARSISQGIFHREYFSANGALAAQKSQLQPALRTDETPENGISNSILSPGTTGLQELGTLSNSYKFTGASSALELPHRRRKRLKYEKKVVADAEHLIPPDASSRLSTLSNSLPPASLRRLFTAYLALSKPRLSFLIVLTTATAYSLYPVPTLLLPTTTISPSLSALTLVFLTAGTTLCTASANAMNMLLEPEHDAKMSRTRNRPIVRGLIGMKGALFFASIAGITGVGSLWFGVNPTVTFLGAFNILLYAGVYTPMKRVSVVNTWVGAVVGGIPPLMGWVAAAGQSATGSGEWRELLFNEQSIGGWLLAGLLFAWQFPHFNALSWNIREEYKNAGYRMLVWVNPRMNGRVAFRYTLLLFPICGGLWWYGITDQGFLVTSTIANAWIVREAWRFWRQEGHKGSARGLFWASVWYLPVVMVLAMAHKKGLWEGMWRRVVGKESDEDTWIEEEEDYTEMPGEKRRPQQSLVSIGSAVI